MTRSTAASTLSPRLSADNRVRAVADGRSRSHSAPHAPLALNPFASFGPIARKKAEEEQARKLAEERAYRAGVQAERTRATKAAEAKPGRFAHLSPQPPAAARPLNGRERLEARIADIQAIQAAGRPSPAEDEAASAADFGRSVARAMAKARHPDAGPLSRPTPRSPR